MIKDYGFSHNYPYTNFHEMNLDWLLAQMLELRSDMKNFVNQNTIKYADPIQWNITAQYESNTVVVDSQGNAYLSTQPVPAGVNINNTDYWTEIGNFSELFSSVKESIAAADEGASPYASDNRNIGDLVWLSDVLHKVTTPMVTGESYIEGTNCEKITIEDILDGLQVNINNVDNKINAVIAGQRYINVKDHGAKGDGQTDDTQAFIEAVQACKDELKPLYVPAGDYILSDTIDAYRISIFGEGIKNTRLFFSSGHLRIGHQGVYCSDLYIELLTLNNDDMAIECYYMTQSSRLENIYCKNGGISFTRSWYFVTSNIYIVINNGKPYGLKLFGTTGEGGVNGGGFTGIFIYGAVNGILIDSTNGKCETNIFNACTLEACSKEAIKLLGGCSTTHVNGIYCENSIADTDPIVASVDADSGYLIANDVTVRGTQTSDTLFSGDIIAFNIICQTAAKKICTDGKTAFYGIRNTLVNNATMLTTPLFERITATNTASGFVNFGTKSGYQLIKAYTSDGYSCSDFFVNSYQQHYATLYYQGSVVTTPAERTFSCIWIRLS